MFLVFQFLRFLCKFVILRTRGGNKEWFFHRFFRIDPHHITMTKIENRDFALIFSGKRLFNTLSKIDLSDIVIITMNFHQHLAWQMFDSKIWRHRHLKLVPCCSLPDNIPQIKFHLNWIKNRENWIFEIFDPQFFFEKSAKAKLSKLEPFAWSHWIRKYLFYLRY